jgi:hypothetical protein
VVLFSVVEVEQVIVVVDFVGLSEGPSGVFIEVVVLGGAVEADLLMEYHVVLGLYSSTGTMVSNSLSF